MIFLLQRDYSPDTARKNALMARTITKCSNSNIGCFAAFLSKVSVECSFEIHYEEADQEWKLVTAISAPAVMVI